MVSKLSLFICRLTITVLLKIKREISYCVVLSVDLAFIMELQGREGVVHLAESYLDTSNIHFVVEENRIGLTNRK